MYAKTAEKETDLTDVAVDFVVYQAATEGEHAGKMSVLLTTGHGEVYGLGMNTLVTTSFFNTDYPMREGDIVNFTRWVKVNRLSGLGLRKIVVGYGLGAAITWEHELIIWGKGAKTYLGIQGVDIVECYDPTWEVCKFCNYPCSSYGRNVGNTVLSYCKDNQTLVTYESTPPGIPVKQLGNRRCGALVCSSCMMECDIEVMENHSFNFCKNCNFLWDLDDNARPMDVMSTPLGSFLEKLTYAGMIRDVAPGPWGFWVLADSKRLLFSASFMRSYSLNVPYWWKQPLARSYKKLDSVHTTKTDVYVVSDSGLLFKRVQVQRKKEEKHTLSLIAMETGVRKMFSGRSASVCLMDDSTVWIIYSQDSVTDSSTASDLNLEEKYHREVICNSANGCLDVSGILYVDIFYVRTRGFQGCVRKKHPLTGSIIEIIYGELDCKTFLKQFFCRCRVWSDGKMSYDSSAVDRLINRQPLRPLDLIEPRSPGEGSPGKIFHGPKSFAGPITVTNAGLGVPLNATTWPVWGSQLVRKTAFGWRWVTVIAKQALEGVKKFTRAPDLREASLSETALTSFKLPPFQSGLYGNPQFSDFTLYLADGNFPAHRIVLCSTSRYFRQKLTHDHFIPKTMDVKSYNPRSYRCLLKRLYHTEPDRLPIKDMLDLLLIATNYGERYIIAEVEEYIKSSLNDDNVTNVIDIAKKSNFKRIKEACEKYINSEISSPVVNQPTTSSGRPLQKI